jgi:hypothetical protein
MTAIASVNAAMGPAFSTGPVASDSFIRESTSTLVLPQAPSGSSGDASLWVGMGTSNGDLIQSIADNWQSSSWSIFAYTLLSTSGMWTPLPSIVEYFADLPQATTQMPVQGDSSTANAGDKVTMHCKSRKNHKRRERKAHPRPQTSSMTLLAITPRQFLSTVRLFLLSPPVMEGHRAGVVPLSVPRITAARCLLTVRPQCEIILQE